jgi:F-type H+-transporting ATPase subunit a
MLPSLASILTLAAEDPTMHVRDLVLLRAWGYPILTMHAVTVIVAALLCVWVLKMAANAINTGDDKLGNERYVTRGRIGQVIEVMVVYLRDEMIEPVLGKDTTRKYLPFLMTLFFFILFNNLFGLVPFLDIQHLLGIHTTFIGGTATSSITVTAALALCSFFIIQVHGFRELGLKGYLQHLTGGLVPGPVYLLPVVAIVFVVELAGQFIKPMALAIRLFANMVAGHTLMAVLVSFGAQAAKGGMGPLGWGGISLVSLGAATAIMFLEIFVAFVQAFIFMFLTAVFISLLSHHDEHHEEHAKDHTDALGERPELAHAPAMAHAGEVPAA